jgi:dGTPase
VLGETGSARIDTLVRDLVEHSKAAGAIRQGEEVGGAMLRLRKFMFDRVYLAEPAQREQVRIGRMLTFLFDHLAENLPAPMVEGASDAERVTDYIAGMTDRFAIRVFEEFAVPQVF